MPLNCNFLNPMFVILILCCTDFVGASNEVNGSANTVFIHALRRLNYFNSSFSDPILFKAFLRSKPDLPNWMKLVQGSLDDDAFLYGTPPLPQQIFIYVVALNKATHFTSEKIVIVNIGPMIALATYEVEFRIRNMNVEDFLKENEPDQKILKNMHKIWQEGDLQLTKVSSMLDEGGRVPIEDGQKLGVLVRVGNNKKYSRMLVNAENEVKACHEEPNFNMDLSLNRYLMYQLDGCKFRLLPEQRTFEEPVRYKPIILKGNAFKFPPEELPPREYEADFILIMAIPLAILLLLIIFLSCIMFGHREGVELRNKSTPGMQLTQYSSIRRATDNLRILANEREGPAPFAATPTYNASQRCSPSSPSPRYDGSFQASTPRPLTIPQ